MNQGQICMSTERVVVDAQVADAFVDKLASKAATLRAGDPRDGTCPLGAIVDKRSASALQALVEDALAKGATLVCGAARGEQLMDATVLDHVTADMRIYHEESFGPVVCVIRVKDQAQAIAVANDSEYGLAAAVFSRDIPRALQVARRIESGICHINGATVHDEPQMPFGGVKASGHGRFGGMAGVEEFTELRWITVETQAGHFPL
jgi:acyl-CoA reductase-like NAD-dependent aldehyde dehydrogenase